MAQDLPGKYETMGQPAHEAPDTSSGRQASLGVELGMPLPKGQTKASIEREPDKGLEVNIEGKDASLTRVDSSDPEAKVERDAAGKPLATPEAKVDGEVEKPAADTTQDAANEVALPAFDPEKPEAVEAYQKRYVGEDGKSFNMGNLSADWAKNAKVDPKTGEISGALSEDTYKFLESKGIDRATVKSVEAGQVAAITLKRQEVFNQAGGEEKYTAAIAWAKAGGYDAAAQAKFNADLDAGGQARKDAIDLLMQRNAKANPQPRQVSPRRTTADAASPAGGPQAVGVKPYANYQEYQTDLRKARATNDQALLDTSRARLKASPWHNA